MIVVMVVDVIARAATPARAAGAMFSRRNGRSANIREVILSNTPGKRMSVLMNIFVGPAKTERLF